MQRPQKQTEDHGLYRLSAVILSAGNAVSVLLLAVGIVLLLRHKNPVERHSHSLLTAWHNLLHGQPAGFLEVGLQTVVLTPIVTSVGICIYALIRKQRSLLIPSLLVIGGLALSLWMGIGW